MSLNHVNILLADDDIDDILFFKEALRGLSLSTHLTTVPDGENLMHLLLNITYVLPDVLFLDLNMPRKNGFECLTEIKQNSKLELLPIVVFSTSFEQEVVNQLYQNGAHYFIRKPSDFSKFKKIILQTLLNVMQGNTIQPVRENFVINLRSDAIV
ncbi:MAG: response regulator [Saprospiraceae bacterium]